MYGEKKNPLHSSVLSFPSRPQFGEHPSTRCFSSLLCPLLLLVLSLPQSSTRSYKRVSLQHASLGQRGNFTCSPKAHHTLLERRNHPAWADFSSCHGTTALNSFAKRSAWVHNSVQCHSNQSPVSAERQLRSAPAPQLDPSSYLHLLICGQQTLPRFHLCITSRKADVLLYRTGRA